jgi:hypothetical protein
MLSGGGLAARIVRRSARAGGGGGDAWLRECVLRVLREWRACARAVRHTRRQRVVLRLVTGWLWRGVRHGQISRQYLLQLAFDELYYYAQVVSFCAAHRLRLHRLHAGRLYSACILQNKQRSAGYSAMESVEGAGRIEVPAQTVEARLN